MITKINKPKCPYSKDWAEYFSQNPVMHKSVGAAASGGEGEGEGGNEGGSGDAQARELKELKESVRRLEENNHSLMAEKVKARKEAEESAAAAARKSGDVEAIEASWQAKLKSDIGDKDAAIDQLQGMLNQLTVGAAASSIASEISIKGSESVMIPHIESRMSVEVKNGKPEVRVLDVYGKPSALTLSDLKKEFAENKAFGPLLIGSKASGDGAAGATAGGSGGGGKTVGIVEYDSWSPARQHEFTSGGGVPVGE